MICVPNTRAARKVATIGRRLPSRVKLPPEFAAFVELVTHPTDPRRDLMNVRWSDPLWLLNADKSAVDSFVPFLLFADGGVAAFWVDGTDLRVARCDSEGQYGVLALDFRDFTARLTKPDAALLEQLELREPLDMRALARGHKPRRVPASMNKAFSRWVESHSLDAKTTQTSATEVVRKTLHAIARRMLADGLSKVNKPNDSYWDMSFRLTKVADRWDVTYLDYGVWYPMPAKYSLATVLPDLVAAMKTRKKSYDLSVCKDGEVFADRGNQVYLKP